MTSRMPTSLDSGSHRAPQHLVIQGVSAGYNGVSVVSGVSISVGRREVVSVLGPNGAGKSTLLKAITGHVALLEGRILLGDEDVTNVRTDRLVRKGIGYVPQVNDVFSTLTVAENLEMGAYLLAHSEISQRMDEVIAIFPALDKLRGTTVSKLSGGERKMVAIGRVLMMRPTVLILDEPTSSLSSQLSRAVLEDQVGRLARTEIAVLLVEQKAQEALKISTWAYIMVGGVIQIAGPANELLTRRDIGEIFLGMPLPEDTRQSHHLEKGDSHEGKR